MFIRILIFSAVIWLAWRMLKGASATKKRPQPKTKVVQSKKMVKCALCHTHLPVDQAVHSDKLWFCNLSHKVEYKNPNS